MSTMDLDLERDEDRRLELMVLGKLERPSTEPWIARGPKPVMTSYFVSLNGREPRVVGWTLESVAIQRADGYVSFEQRSMVEGVYWRNSEAPPHEALMQLEYWLAHQCWRAVLVVTGYYQELDRSWMQGQEVLASYRQAAQQQQLQAEQGQDALVLGRDEPCIVAEDDPRVYVEPNGGRYEAMCLSAHDCVSLGWATRRGHKLHKLLVDEQEGGVFNPDFGWVDPKRIEQVADGKVGLLCRYPAGQ